MLRLLVLGTVLCACHFRAGFDAAARSSGPLASAVHHPSIARTDGVIELPPVAGRSYTVAGGFGDRTIAFGLALTAHDVTQNSFSAGGGYLLLSGAADIRWTILRLGPVAPVLGAGPVRMVLMDRSTGTNAWAYGIRFGGGLQVEWGKLAIFSDVYREVVAFSSGPAQGNSTLDGITLGLSFTP